MSQVEQVESPQLDTAPENGESFTSQAQKKVQLDIDDAPFLQEEKPEEVAVVEESLPAEEPTFDEEIPEPPKKLWQKRPFQIAVGGGVLALILLAIWVYIAYFRAPAPTVVEAPPSIIVVPSEQALAGSQSSMAQLKPFMVEQRDGQTVRFLQAAFTLVSTEEGFTDEVQEKLIVLRDAIFYYLRNQTHAYLIDPLNTVGIKQDLLDIVNGYLVRTQGEDILFENYILK